MWAARRRAVAALVGRLLRAATTTTPTTTTTRPRATSARPTPATASSSTWPSAARRSRCSTDLADDVQPVRRRRGRRALRLRAAAQRGVRPRRHADPAGLAEPGGQRRAAGHLVAGRVGAGPASSTHRGRAGAGARRHAVHAHAARHRHAPADGRGARLAGRADRLRRPRCRWPTNPRGLGLGRPPRVGPVPPRQDEPQLLDERAQLHDRRVLRGRRQDAGPDDRGPRPARPPSSSPARSSRRSSTTATSR